ncbi:MAG: flagellar assembly protein FliW [Lachnospiraceae bacterium]|nr:flagellar assembly protein FliW [Lachnospiraceae bacterium]
MQLNTRLFGEIEIEEDKIIFFEKGIIGFPDCNQFTLISDLKEDGSPKGISWLQSLDEPAFALPVMDPLLVKEDYRPWIAEEMLKPLGDLNEENIYILVSVTATEDITKLSVNLKAPFIINAEERKGHQIIVEDDFPVKFMVYDILKAKKEEAGE